MFSARFEEALLTASDEEIRSFFAELPQPARRRLIAILAEVDSASAQHFLDINNLDGNVDLADLQWPSEPETQPVRQPTPALCESSSDVSLESWGIFGLPVQPAGDAVFGGTPHNRPQRSAPVPPVPPVPLQAAASSSSDPAPLHLQQAAAAKRAAAPAAPPMRDPPAASASSPLPGSAFLGPEAPEGMRWATPTVPPPPDLAASALPAARARRAHRRRSWLVPPCGRPCTNPRCTDTCPRVDDPSRRDGHRHHACDACHRRGW